MLKNGVKFYLILREVTIPGKLLLFLSLHCFCVHEHCTWFFSAGSSALYMFAPDSKISSRSESSAVSVPEPYGMYLL